MRRVAVEEAFSIPEVWEALGSWALDADPDEPDMDFWNFVFSQDAPVPQRVRRQLMDLEDERLKIMDAHGVSMHVLSLTAPGVQTFAPARAVSLARLANDRLAAVIARHPARFAGLATVPVQDPEAAALEIARAITELRLNGLVINSRAGSEHLDEEKYWPVLEAAQAYGAPVCLRSPSPWGYQAEAGQHALRMITGGIFDRFPDLHVVLGRLGEGLPYWMHRLDAMHPVRASYRKRPALSLTPSEYMKRNITMTTSGMNWAPVLRFCIEAVGADNIMFAIDYPYQLTEGAVRFLDEADISEEDKIKIFHKNAERIFGVSPAPTSSGVSS